MKSDVFNRIGEWFWENYFIVYWGIFEFRRVFVGGGTLSDAIFVTFGLIAIFSLTFKTIESGTYQKTEISDWLNYLKASKRELLRPILTSVGFLVIAIPIGLSTDMIILFFVTYLTFEFVELRKLLRLKINDSL